MAKSTVKCHRMTTLKQLRHHHQYQQTQNFEYLLLFVFPDTWSTFESTIFFFFFKFNKSFLVSLYREKKSVLLKCQFIKNTQEKNFKLLIHRQRWL